MKINQTSSMSPLAWPRLCRLPKEKVCVLFVFVVLPGSHTPKCLADYLSLRTGRNLSREEILAIFKYFEREGVLCEDRSLPIYNDPAMNTPYRLAQHIDLEALRYLTSQATERNWWPTRELLEMTPSGRWAGEEEPESVRVSMSPRQLWNVSEAIRALLCWKADADFMPPLDAPYLMSSVCYTAVGWLIQLLPPNRVFPVRDMSDRVFEIMGPFILSSCFMRGGGLWSLLHDTSSFYYTEGGQRHEKAFLVACALCVWTSDKTILEFMRKYFQEGSLLHAFGTFCLGLFSGRPVLDRELTEQVMACFAVDHSAEVPAPLWLLFLALALKAQTPENERFALRLIEDLTSHASREGWHPLGRRLFAANLRKRWQLVNIVLRAVSSRLAVEPRRDITSEGAAQEQEMLLRKGLPTLAAIHLAEAYRMGVPIEEARQMENRLVEAHAVQLLPVFAPSELGKYALEALSACLPKTPPAKKKTPAKMNGTIVWELFFEPCGSTDTSIYRCTKLMPYYRGPRAAQDGTDDKRIQLRSLRTPKYQSCMTEQDATIVQSIRDDKFDPYVSASRLQKIMEALCGHPHLMELYSGVPGCDTIKTIRYPVTIVAGVCEAATETCASGELTLSLPNWLIAAREYGYVFVSDGDAHYSFHAISPVVRNVAAVFARNGIGGKIVLPKESQAEAKDVLERLAGVMNVGGSLAAGGNAGFTRVEGDATPCVRLDYVGGELHVALVVEPMVDKAVAACAPGDGVAERLVQVKGGKTVLLARDLKKETVEADRVRDALAPFDAWAVERDKWCIARPDAALEALRTVKGLADVKIEWRDGEKVKVTAPSAHGVNLKASGTDWFEFKGEVACDDGRVIELMKLLSLLESREGNYVRFGENDYLYLSHELLRRMEALAAVATTGGGRGARNRVAPAAVPMLAAVFEGGEAESLPQLPEVIRARAEAIRRAQTASVEWPKRFSGSLRAYQETGYVWLERLAASGFGACLADDMGLGKTVQLIALLLKRAADGVSLVVAPASVCVNWVREIERFAPTLRPMTTWDLTLGDADLKPGAVVVTSYGLLVSREEEFAAVDWNGVVLDEAQAIKNAATRRAHVACRLKAKFRVAVTGTPVENHLLEFWSIFSFLNPGLLGTEREFAARFTADGFATKSLKRLVEPFVLRRLKRDVLTDLPEKIEVVKHVAFGEEERNAYEALRRRAIKGLRESGEEMNRVSILAALTRLRRFCCHPSLVVPEMKESAKLEAVLELMEELRESGHRALIFSQFVDYLVLVRDAVAAKGWTYRYLDGATPQGERMAAVDAFQKGEADFFLVSLKAGGTGLNLTAANNVILLDPWWNPAVEDQAADRAHRIGQKLPVTVYRVIAEGTVEDGILALHADKRAISDDMLDAAKGTTLTPDRLLALLENA